jgi:NADH-quinone oxidoreductase subunit L
MLMLVMADNLLQLFIFWVVGLCSYLLIGHGMIVRLPALPPKSVIVNRVGDFGFASASFVWYSRSLDITNLCPRTSPLGTS